MEKEEEKFNIIIYIFLILVIIRHVANIFQQLISFMTLGTYGGETMQYAMVIYSMILSIAVIISMVMIQHKRFLGVYVFYALQVVNLIVTSVMGMVTNLMGANDIIGNIIVTIVICGVFTGILFIRENGKSGWNILRNAKS